VKILFIIFTLMGVYGLLIGFYGPGFLSFAMLCLVVWARKELAKREAEYLADPANAKTPSDSTARLTSSDSEAGRTIL